MDKNFSADFVSQLCPNCGLCCNGVLFADVELRKEDDVRRLADLGLGLEKKGRKRAFAQPCACFQGALCRIYSERPAHCRAFECRLLKGVQTGELKAKKALTTIAEARRRVTKVRRLLQRLGQNDEQLALIKRYAHAMREPVDLSHPADAVESQGQLMLTVEALMQMLQRDFLK
jgi:uncharacterized protein